jgi:hypothetical protein
MSFGTFGPLLMLGIGVVVAVGVIVRLVRAARQGRARTELRSIGGAITGAGAAQSAAYGWAPSSLAPMEGPSITPEADDTTERRDDEP